jgi:hypothetical protein
MRAGFASPRLIAKNGVASTRMSSTAGFVPRTSGLNKKFGTFSAWHGETSSESPIAKFNYLCSQIFSKRQAKYLSKLHDGGFFMYSGNKIFRNGDIVSEFWPMC